MKTDHWYKLGVARNVHLTTLTGTKTIYKVGDRYIENECGTLVGLY